MKRFLAVLSILLLSTSSVIAQDAFYYFKDEKIPLQKAEKWTVVQVPSDARAALTEIIGRRSDVRIRRVLNEKRGFYWLESPRRQRLGSEVIGQLARQVSIRRTIPAYRLDLNGDTTHFVITDGFRAEFNQGVSRSEIRQFNEKHGVEIAPMESDIDEFQAREQNEYDLRVTKTSEFSTLEVANLYHEDPRTVWASPSFHSNYRYIDEASRGALSSGKKAPNAGPLVVTLKSSSDALYSKQYYLNNTSSNLGSEDVDIDAPEAWNHTKGSSNITVAVIDEGVAQHEDFSSGQLVKGNTFGSGRSGDGSPISSDENHGQPVAGIVAANHNNSGKVRGVAPNVNIMPLNVGDTGAEPRENALDYACQNGADVLNISWGGPPDTGIANAVSDCRNNGRSGKGAVVVAAAGNTGGIVLFPASESGVLAVGAVDRNDNKQSYTPDDSDVDVIAPSGDTNLNGDVRTTDRMESAGYESGNYTPRFGGTSAAAPQASGTAALMLSIEPQLRENKVRALIKDTAVDYGSSAWSGDGLLNALSAVREAATPRAPTNLTITNAGQVGAHPNLDWDDNHEPDLDHYNVYRCTSHYTACNWSKIAETTTSDYTDTFVIIKDKEDANDEYSYYVSAVDTDNFESDQSNHASTWGTQPLSPMQRSTAQAVPKTFALHPPTPNPAAGQTTIQVDVPETRRVTVTVYDVMGRKVAQVASRTMTPGFHHLSAQPDQWPSGIYFVRMIAGSFTATRRLTVVR